MKAAVCAAIIVVLFMIASQPAQAREDIARRPDRLFRWALGGYVALQATDVYLTQRGTSLGMTEANPVFTSGGSVTAAKAALVPLTTWGLVRLHRTHPKLARGLALGLDAVYLSIAHRNVRVINGAD